MTRKSGKPCARHTRTTGLLFRPNYVSSAVYTVILPPLEIEQVITEWKADPLPLNHIAYTRNAAWTSLYNIWYGFSVRSEWPRVLWQAVTLWLVNRAVTVVGIGKSNRCVSGRRPRDNHAVRFRQNPEYLESSKEHAADQRVRSSLTIRLARKCKR